MFSIPFYSLYSIRYTPFQPLLWAVLPSAASTVNHTQNWQSNHTSVSPPFSEPEYYFVTQGNVKSRTTDILLFNNDNFISLCLRGMNITSENNLQRFQGFVVQGQRLFFFSSLFSSRNAFDYIIILYRSIHSSSFPLWLVSKGLMEFKESGSGMKAPTDPWHTTLFNTIEPILCACWAETAGC
jgi:hypothetical protein